MIVTVSIRKENPESHVSLTQSIATKSGGVFSRTSAVRNAILDAGVAVIAEAKEQGWLDD